MDPASAERVGLTIFEFGEVGGPGFGGCPALADYAVTSSDPGIINNATAGQDLKVSGVSQNASAVSVNLDGQDATTSAVTADATTSPVAGDTQGNQTWTATFTAAQVGGLKDGTLTATGTYTVNGTPLNGVNLKLKDAVVPAAPTASHTRGVTPQVRTSYSSTQIPTRMRRSTTGVRTPCPSDPDATDPIFTKRRTTSRPRSRSRR